MCIIEWKYLSFNGVVKEHRNILLSQVLTYHLTFYQHKALRLGKERCVRHLLVHFEIQSSGLH